MPIRVSDLSILADGLDHPECLAVHPDGSVWAGGEAGQIYRIEPGKAGAPGKPEEVGRMKNGFALGIAFTLDARTLVACDLKNGALWRMDLASGRVRRWMDTVAGHRLVIPNHMTFARDGTLYLTDSGGTGKPKGTVLAIDADGRGRVWHAGPYNFANGTAISPDGSALYVVCTWLPGVERIEIRPDGSPGRRSIFVRLNKALPDGITFDAAGNLYIACYTPARIYRVNPAGKATVLVEDWEAHTLSNPTNVAFGGPDFNELYAANLGRWHLTRIPVGVKGAPLACHALAAEMRETAAKTRGRGRGRQI